MRISPFMLIGVLLLPAQPVLADEVRSRDFWALQKPSTPADLQPNFAQFSPSAYRPTSSTQSWMVAEQTPPATAPQKPTPAATAERPDGTEAVMAAQTKLAWELIERLSKEGSADSTISPAGLASAFAILAKGADAKMKAAIATALGFETGDPAKSLVALSKARTALSANSGEMLQSADRIIIEPESAPPPHLAARLKKLGVEFTAEDLSKPEAVARIDEWVKKTTQGAIPEILGEPLDKASFAVLDALHFKGTWKDQFDPQKTSQTAFQSADGSNGDVAMMHLAKGSHVYRTNDKFMGIDLPFSNERFSLTVITTMEKPAQVAEFAEVKDWLSGAGFEERKGDLAMPRFKLSARSDLLPALDAFGLAKGRHSPTALAGFGQGTVLSRVLQRAIIEVDEEGATAAAATAIVGRRSVDDSLHMVVDKPFIFALRDHESGLILVAGYIGRAPSH